MFACFPVAVTGSDRNLLRERGNYLIQNNRPDKCNNARTRHAAQPCAAATPDAVRGRFGDPAAVREYKLSTE